MSIDAFHLELILDHYRRPHHAGLREPYDAEAHFQVAGCADEVTLRVSLDDGPGGPTVRDVSYEAQGCSISQAATSVMTDLVIGRRLDDALAVYGRYLEMLQPPTSSSAPVEPDEEVLGDAVAFAGIARQPARLTCALAGWTAFRDAVAQARAAQ